MEERKSQIVDWSVISAKNYVRCYRREYLSYDSPKMSLVSRFTENFVRNSIKKNSGCSSIVTGSNGLIEIVAENISVNENENFDVGL